MSSTDSPEVKTSHSIETLGLHRSSDLSKLIHTWAQILATQVNTESEWVDLMYQKSEVIRCNRYKKMKVRKLESTKPSVVYSPVRRLEEQKSFDKSHFKTMANNNAEVLSSSIKIETKVTRSQTHTLTMGLNLGFSLTAHVGPFGDIGSTVEIDLSNTKETSQTLEQTINDEVKVEVRGYHEATCIMEVWKVPHVRDFTIKIDLSGDVPIYFKNKVRYQDGKLTKPRLGWKAKHILFLPITEVLKQLKNSNMIPPEIGYQEDGTQLTLQGKCTEDVFETNVKLKDQMPIKSIQNNLGKKVQHFKRQHLKKLKDKIQELQTSQLNWITCAITGVAGCGKSELAKVYALEYGSSPLNPSKVFRWRLDPDPDTSQNNATRVSYQRAFADVLYNFGIQNVKIYDSEPEDLMQQRLNGMLWEKITQCPQWIVIFDNAFIETDTQKYYPSEAKNRGQIIITTQNNNFINKENTVSINEGLDPGDAAMLLREMSRRDQEENQPTQNLVKELDCSPLAIRIAGSFICKMDMGFEEYTQLLKKDRAEELVRMQGSGIISNAVQDVERTATLQATLKRTIGRLQGQKSRLIESLQYCGYLANENIPLKLLAELCRKSGEETESTQLELKSVYMANENYSLLTYDGVKESCYLHRTTQVVLRSLTLSPLEMIQKVVSTILRVYVYNRYSMKQLQLYQKMAPHFLALNEHIKSDPTMAQFLATEQIKLLLLLGRLDYKFSQYSQALKYLLQAQELAQTAPESTQEIVLILRYLANTKYYLGELLQARQYMEQALEIGKCIYKPTDWELARLHNELGDILKSDLDVDPQEVRNNFERGREICENGQSDCKDLDIYVQLCYSHRGLGQYFRRKRCFTKTLEHYKQVLELSQRHLGKDDHKDEPDAAGMYIELGTLGLYTDPERFTDVGIDYLRSREYLDEFLRIMTLGYGLRSYQVANLYYWRSRLLYVSEKREDWESALQDQNHAIKIRREIFGDTYQELTKSYYWQGRILQKLYPDGKAQQAYQASLKLGQQNPKKYGKWIVLNRDCLAGYAMIQKSG